jgi:hypothetical protein
LTNEPFLAFVFSVPHVAMQDFKDMNALEEILNMLLDHSRALKVATYYSEYFSFVFADNRRYYPFLNKFSAKLFGAGIGESYTDDVKDEYAIDNELRKELSKLDEEMQGDRMNKLLTPAYFIDGNNAKQKVWFANYFFNAIVEQNE